MSCPDYDGQRVFLHKPTGRKVKGLIRIMTMTEMHVKSLRQWYGGDWESVIKLSWRAMAEELLDLQRPTFAEFGASQAAARAALGEVQKAKAAADLEEGKLIEEGYEPLDEEMDEDGFYVVPF